MCHRPCWKKQEKLQNGPGKSELRDSSERAQELQDLVKELQDPWKKEKGQAQVKYAKGLQNLQKRDNGCKSFC